MIFRNLSRGLAIAQFVFATWAVGSKSCFRTFQDKDHSNASIYVDATEVCHSSPVLTTPPFHEFLKHLNHDSWSTISGNSWKGRFDKTGEEWHTSGML
jgi:Iap family predicted aminopeptidase